LNYLIGGSSRCGKSTLARALRHRTGAHGLSGDALRDTLRKTTAPGTIPELNQPRAEKIVDEREFVEYHTLRAGDEIDKKRQQAAVVWPFLHNYLVTINRESSDVAVAESIDIWPDLIATSGLAHRAVFLVDTAPGQWERIVATRGVDTKDWMHANGYSDERIQAWSAFNAQRSQVVKSLCDEYAYPCVDLAETGFAEAQRLALDMLQTQPLHGHQQNYFNECSA